MSKITKIYIVVASTLLVLFAALYFSTLQNGTVDYNDPNSAPPIMNTGKVPQDSPSDDPKSPCNAAVLKTALYSFVSKDSANYGFRDIDAINAHVTVEKGWALDKSRPNSLRLHTRAVQNNKTLKMNFLKSFDLKKAMSGTKFKVPVPHKNVGEDIQYILCAELHMCKNFSSVKKCFKHVSELILIGTPRKEVEVNKEIVIEVIGDFMMN